MKQYLPLPEILTAVNGTEAGEALYNNKSGEVCGFVCQENSVFTDIEETKEILAEYLKDCSINIIGDFAPAYTETGNFRGFYYRTTDST